jgi:hypothetical protein
MASFSGAKAHSLLSGYGMTEEVAEKSSISALHFYSRACSPTQKLQHGPDFSVRSVFKDTTALVLHRRN